jgi:hypothetical protein
VGLDRFLVVVENRSGPQVAFGQAEALLDLPQVVVGVYHHKRESIEAHRTIVFAALADYRLVEERTGWSIRKFVRTGRRYRTITIRVGQQLLTAEDPPTDLRKALALIR